MYDLYFLVGKDEYGNTWYEKKNGKQTDYPYSNEAVWEHEEALARIREIKREEKEKKLPKHEYFIEDFC